MYRKAAKSISQISVSFSDINGPKGGNDKLCKLKLTLAGQPSVLIVTKKDTIEKAFVEALKRANHTLFRTLKRKQQFKRTSTHRQDESKTELSA